MFLGDFDVLYREAEFSKCFYDVVPVVALEDDLIPFCGAAACADCFEFLCEATHVEAFLIDAVDDSDGASPLSGLQVYSYSLLFFGDGSTDAEVFGESAFCANLRHSGFLLLPTL